MTFMEWLMTATEDDKREASDYRHHFPVEQQVLDVLEGNPMEDAFEDLVLDEARRLIVCGCNEHMAYPYGSGGHGG